MPDEEPPDRPPVVVEHDWEDVQLPERDDKTYEFDVPSKEDPEKTEHVVLNLAMSFAYLKTVGKDEKGNDVHEPVRSLRRCRSCLQESQNGDEPREPCGLAQVRRVMEE